jgi:hypothetical protein
MVIFSWVGLAFQRESIFRLWAFSRLARQSFSSLASKSGAIKLGFLAVSVTFGTVSAKYVP